MCAMSKTTFRGRLGYACLNSYLREQKEGAVFCSRTCRMSKIKSDGIQCVKELALQNVADLKQIVEWNEANGIRFFRLSSDLFPFASHPDHSYSLDFADSQLKEIGALAKKYKHRLTMHPGQYTVLGSIREDVNANGARDLIYHTEILDRMGLDKDSVIILHMGGAYGNKAATLERFAQNFKTMLPKSCQQRLVLENDDSGAQGYTVEDLLPVCQLLSIPLVLDWHHDKVNPSSKPVSEYLQAVRDTWKVRSIRQKQHYSEPKYPKAVLQSEKRAHSDRVKVLPELLLNDIPEHRDIDLMIEAKDKEQAVFELYKTYNLYPVNEKYVLPPRSERPAPRPTKAPVSKKTKTVKVEEVEASVEQTVDKKTVATKRKSAKLAESVCYSELAADADFAFVEPKPKFAKISKGSQENGIKSRLRRKKQ